MIAKRKTGDTKGEIAARLGQALRNAGWEMARGDVRRIAEHYGVERESVRKWLSGESIPRTHILSDIATAGGTTTTQILQGIDPNTLAAPRTQPDGIREPAHASWGAAALTAQLADLVTALSELIRNDPGQASRILAAMRALIPPPPPPAHSS